MNLTPIPQQDARPASQILETLGSQLARPTTERRSQDCNESEKLKKRQEWLNKWLNAKITHPKLEKARHDIYEFCSEYCKHPARGRTLVIYGDNGTGKSKFSKQISYWARRIAIKLPLVQDQLGTQGNMSIPSTSFVSWPDVVDGFKRDEWQLLEDLQAATMLIVDDIGAEHDPSRIGVEKLYVLLNRREFRWNVFSTNILPAHWPEKLERRISSRLFRNAHHIDLSDVPDYSTV